MRLKTLQGTWDETCVRCNLHEGRNGHAPLFGHGNLEGEFLIITEAPSLEDASAQILFAGDLGEFLYSLLSGAGIDPDNTYRTTMVSCPSYLVIPETETEGERIAYQNPTAEQVKTCMPRLQEIIYRVDPKLIICFGDIPWKSLTGSKQRGRRHKVADALGDLFDCYVPGRILEVRYPLLALMPLLSIATNPSTAAHAPIAVTAKHLARARDYVAKTTISEKAT